MNRWTTAILLLVTMCMAGCGRFMTTNRSFALSIPDSRAALRQMRDDPTRLERPVLVLGGFIDVGIGPTMTGHQLRRVTGDARVVGVAFAFSSSFDECRRRVLAVMAEHFPSDDPTQTAEVDVVAISMGGLVARYCAAPPDDAPPGPRLRIARLFTIGTPHRGAALADLPTRDRLQIDMRAGSPLLAHLDAALESAPYALYPYVRLNDAVVGPANAAPHGRMAWWVDTPAFDLAHLRAQDDPRIIADIARRLRGEPPYTTEPPEGLPDDIDPLAG
jgi:hypothetical protein